MIFATFLFLSFHSVYTSNCFPNSLSKNLRFTTESPYSFCRQLVPVSNGPIYKGILPDIRSLFLVPNFLAHHQPYSNSKAFAYNSIQRRHERTYSSINLVWCNDDLNSAPFTGTVRTEKVNVAVRDQTCGWKVAGSKLDQDTGWHSWEFVVTPSGIPSLGYDSFLPDPL